MSVVCIYIVPEPTKRGKKKKVVVIGINTHCVKYLHDSDSDSNRDLRSHRDRDRQSSRFSFIQMYGPNLLIYTIYSTRTPFHRFSSYPFAPIRWSGLGVSVALEYLTAYSHARCDLSSQRDCSVLFDLSNAQRKQQTHIFIHLVYVQVFSRSSSWVSACTNLELYVAAESYDDEYEQRAESTNRKRNTFTDCRADRRTTHSIVPCHSLIQLRTQSSICVLPFFPSSRFGWRLCMRVIGTRQTLAHVEDIYSRYSSPTSI